MSNTTLSPSVRSAILGKAHNHAFAADGFCTHCQAHRTDWRKNDLCPELIRREKVATLAASIVQEAEYAPSHFYGARD